MDNFTIQKIIYDLLVANSALNTLVGGRIYDRAIADTNNVQYPYIALGDCIINAKHTNDKIGSDTVQYINIHDKPDLIGHYRIKNIAKEIDSVLDRKGNFNLQTSGYTNTEISGSIKELQEYQQEGEYIHCFSKYRMYVFETV